jgi:translation elongation factor EF-1alpha
VVNVNFFLFSRYFVWKHCWLTSVWFCTSGPSLLEFLDEMELVDRKVNAPLMMPISEKYNDMGTKVVGKLESGQLRKGQNVLLMPNKVSKLALSFVFIIYKNTYVASLLF